MSEGNNFDKIIEELKDIEPTEEEIEMVNNLAEIYSDKSEEDIFVEIIKLNEEMASKMEEDEYNAIFEKLESIKPFLDEEQQKKLEKIMKVLRKK